LLEKVKHNKSGNLNKIGKVKHN